MNKLLEAAKAVIARWDTPLWKDVPATAVYIGALREAVALESELAQVVEPVAFFDVAVNERTAAIHYDMKHGLKSGDKLYTAPQAVNAERKYLQPADLGDLMRFQETTDDSEGYDIGKPAVKRLAELGVLQSHGFGTYGITAFGHFALEHMFSQRPSLPLMTNDDRDRAAIAKAPGATT